jgi:3-mercaptopyruvate sulfurtransferase SseA
VPFQEIAPEAMAALFQSWGLRADRDVVLCDPGGSALATRLFFSLFFHGFPAERLHILDGGLARWQALGFPVTQAVPPAPRPGTFTPQRLRHDCRAGVAEVVAASGDPARNVLLEGLTPEWHFGKVMTYERRGHIPHARMLPYAELLNADKTYKSPDEIRGLLALMGIRPEQTIYTHCGGGIAGSVPFFALKFIAGLADVRHFPESQLGWLHDERGLPFWTYDAPHLLRDAAWLHCWGGQRTRTLGSIHVSIVDVRDRPAYDAGHMPFALHLPAGVFRAGLADRHALAGQLGRAGVDPAHEAVIVSGKGLDRDAALAFVALAALGQRRVSIFADTLDEWAGQGYPLTQTPTVVGTPTRRRDLTVPVVDHAAAPGDEVLFRPGQAAEPAFPRVFIASGERPMAGRVVHVHHALLVQDGRPLAADRIWDILSQAGVPRFAELVVVADDPADAAVNFVVLKLMGYPSVRLMGP